MNHNQKQLWLALTEMADFYARLGGSARPQNMREIEIPIYITSQLVNGLSEGCNTAFLQSVEPISKKIQAMLDKVDTGSPEFLDDMEGFFAYVESHIPSEIDSATWQEFRREFSEKATVRDFRTVQETRIAGKV